MCRGVQHYGDWCHHPTSSLAQPMGRSRTPLPMGILTSTEKTLNKQILSWNFEISDTARLNQQADGHHGTAHRPPTWRSHHQLNADQGNRPRRPDLSKLRIGWLGQEQRAWGSGSALLLTPTAFWEVVHLFLMTQSTFFRTFGLSLMPLCPQEGLGSPLHSHFLPPCAPVYTRDFRGQEPERKCNKMYWMLVMGNKHRKSPSWVTHLTT